MAKYGIPYQGSKAVIAEELIKLFPKADNFYDLFGGGFSITHALLTKRRQDYKHFHFNEINPLNNKLIQSAISGDFNYSKFKPPFITREEFFAKKDTDGYIRYLWSFGNDSKSYLFSKQIENYKKIMHNAIVFDIFEDLAKEVLGFDIWPKELNTIKKRRLSLRPKIEYYRKTNTLPESLYPFLSAEVVKQIKDTKQTEHLRELSQLRKMQQLEQLERLQWLQQLETSSVTFTSLDYREVKIFPNSIIYCDPPYQKTKQYQTSFDFFSFLDWAAAQTCPVFISEYNIQDSRFTKIWEKAKRKGMQAGSTADKVLEKVYVNSAGLAVLQTK